MRDPKPKRPEPERQIHPVGRASGKSAPPNPLKTFSRLLAELHGSIRQLNERKESAWVQRVERIHEKEVRVEPGQHRLEREVRLVPGRLDRELRILPGRAERLRVRYGPVGTESSRPPIGSKRHSPVSVPNRSRIPPPQSWRVPAPYRPSSRLASRSLPTGSLLRHPGVTGADREAIRHVTEHRGGPGQLPSAARLAQLLRTERTLTEEGRHIPPALAQLTQAIRSGSRREVADLDPERVQALMEDALGGPTRAEQVLAGPEVHSLVDRHQLVLGNIHSQLSEKERRLERVSSVSPGRGSASVTARAVPDRPRHYRSAAARAGWPEHRTAPGKTDTAQAELSHMLATNEEPHLAGVAGVESERIEHEIRQSGSIRNRVEKPEMQARPIRPLTTQMRQERPVTPSMTAPARSGPSPIQQLQQVTRGDQQQQRRRMEVTGKMTLIGESGQPIGKASMDAELR